jgi:hypothetical protein
MAQAAQRISRSAAPAKAAPSRPDATGSAVDPEETKRKPGKPVDKPGAGRSSKLGRKAESPASLRTAGPSGQRSRTADLKKHANK